MPQLLYYLNLEADGEATAMDWSTVAVYSCENSCEPRLPTTSLLEHAHVQLGPEKE
jgi:hypothetical protein